MRTGATLGYEDALGLIRALSLLGGSYLSVAQQLLKVRLAPRLGHACGEPFAWVT